MAARFGRPPSKANEPEWEERATSLLDRPSVPAAQATGQLLRSAQARWNGRVIPRTWMHDLLFTVPGHPYPFDQSVRVSWADGIFKFRLVVDGGTLQTADRCRGNKAAAVLDSFLVQLVGGEPWRDEGDRGRNDHDVVVSAIRAAWEEGCPVASDPEGTATIALRRTLSIRRRHNRTPSPAERIEDLATGLRDRLETDPKLVGRLMEDYRYLATKIIEALS